MANKLIIEMGLPQKIANLFAARNIRTAKEALSLTEFELMEILDVGLEQVTEGMTRISKMACPHFQTALSLLEQQRKDEHLAGHLPTMLKGLDAALCGGIPFGLVTELVGPAGIGKTQFCLKLALLAALPTLYGGLGGRVIYVDVESKFSSRRMIEMGFNSFPEIFRKESLAQEMAGRILVLRPGSLLEFTESLQQLKVTFLQDNVRLLIVDSMAALVSGEYDQGPTRHHPLGWHISFMKSLAAFSRTPVVITNHVRYQGHETSQYMFQKKADAEHHPPKSESHLVATLGIHWAHAVSIRLVLESRSGKRILRIVKSPISPSLGFLFTITASGISLLDDEGIDMAGSDASKISCQGHGQIHMPP